MASNKKCSAIHCSKNGLIYSNDKYERINDHAFYHQNCFRCTNCNSKLNIQTYAQSKNNILLCKNCSEAINTSKKCSAVNCDQPLLDTEKFIIAEGGICYHSHCFQNVSEITLNDQANVDSNPYSQIKTFPNADIQNRSLIDTKYDGVALEDNAKKSISIGFEGLAFDVMSSSNDSSEIRTTENDEKQIKPLVITVVTEVDNVVPNDESVKIGEVKTVEDDVKNKSLAETKDELLTNSIVKIDVKNLGSPATPRTPYSPSSLERDDRCGSLRIVRKKEYDTRSISSNKSFLNSSRISLNAFKSKVSTIFTTKKRVERSIQNNLGAYEILIRYDENKNNKNVGRLCVQIKRAILKDTGKKNAYAGIQLFEQDRYTKSIYDTPKPEFEEQFDYLAKRKTLVMQETLILTDYRSKWGKMIRTKFGTISISLANIDEINGISKWYNIESN